MVLLFSSQGILFRRPYDFEVIRRLWPCIKSHSWSAFWCPFLYFLFPSHMVSCHRVSHCLSRAGPCCTMFPLPIPSHPSQVKPFLTPHTVPPALQLLGPDARLHRSSFHWWQVTTSTSLLMALELLKAKAAVYSVFSSVFASPYLQPQCVCFSLFAVYENPPALSLPHRSSYCGWAGDFTSHFFTNMLH